MADTRARRIPSNSSTSSSSTSASTSSSLAFQPDHGLQLINHVYQQLMDVVNHRYLNRFIGPFDTSENRMIHIDSLFASEDKLFRRLFRMCKPLFWRLVRLLESDLVFANNSPNGEQQIPPHYQIAVALWRLGQYGNGSSLLKAHDQFKMAEGTVYRSTTRVLIAIQHTIGRFIPWPNAAARVKIKSQIARQTPFPNCIGFVDGTLIKFAYKPDREDAADWFCRKDFYGFNIMAIVDWEKRVIGMYTGWVAAANDTRVWGSSPWGSDPEKHFSEGEYVLGDSGYHGRENLVTCYDQRHRHIMTADEMVFNRYHSRARVKVEGFFGALKMRFQSLMKYRGRVSHDRSVATADLWIITCFTLHNALMDLSLELGITDDYWESDRRERGISPGEQEREWADEGRLWTRQKGDAVAAASASMGRDRTDNRTREMIRGICESNGYEAAVQFEE